MLNRVIAWFKNTIRKKPVVRFPAKQGQDVASCVAVLDLTGSAFCLDNHNILFKDTRGELKVLKPVTEMYSTNSNANLSAREVDDGFTIKWEEKEYMYYAKFKTIKFAGHEIFQLLNIRQPVYGITTDTGKIKLNEAPG